MVKIAIGFTHLLKLYSMNYLFCRLERFAQEKIFWYFPLHHG